MSIFSKEPWRGLAELLGVDFGTNLKSEMLEISRSGGLEKSALLEDGRKIELSVKIRALFSLREKFDHYYANLHFNSFSNPSPEFLEADSRDSYLASFYLRCLGRRKDIAEKLMLDLMEIEFLEIGIAFPFRYSLKIDSGTYLCLKGKKIFDKIF